MKTVYTLEEVVKTAISSSEYYKELYSDIDLKNISIEKLPIVNQEDFWKSNQWNNNKLITATPKGGTLLKSGGTTGSPKFSIFSKDEWEDFTEIFGEGMFDNILDEGDRVGNLFYAGELYSSFIFIMKSFEYAPKEFIHFPIGGALTNKQIINIIDDYQINALAGVPTGIINLAIESKENGIQLPIKKILFGGEPMFDDQIEVVKSIWEGVEIASIGHASVDGGHLGYCDSSCKNGEHRPFLNSSILEIVDDEGKVIEELNTPGKIIYTNLARKLMPIVRYPAGDRAIWTEVGCKGDKFLGQKYKLVGRSSEGARIGPVTVSRDDVAQVLQKLNLAKSICAIQLVVDRDELRDSLTVRLASCDGSEIDLSKVEEAFYQERAMFLDSVKSGVVNPVKFVLVRSSDLERNVRTGKLIVVLDRRGL